MEQIKEQAFTLNDNKLKFELIFNTFLLPQKNYQK